MEFISHGKIPASSAWGDNFWKAIFVIWLTLKWNPQYFENYLETRPANAFTLS